MTRTASPYGSWTSPISAEAVAAGAHPVDSARLVGDEIWWSERRPTEGGRTGIFARSTAGVVRDLLPAPAGVRSRVHEYGGGAWTVTDDRELVHVQASDQQVVLTGADGTHRALTPAARGVAFGDLSVQNGRLLAVRETLEPHVHRAVVEIPLDGSGATDPRAIRILADGSDFSAYPRLSPDGSKLARIAWDHPQMAWDGTRLEVDELTGPTAGDRRVLLGGPEESVLQPEWRGEEELLVVTDRSGYWQPVVVDLGGRVTEGPTQQRDVGGPLWNLGLRVLAVDEGSDGGATNAEVLLRSTRGSDRLEVLGADGGRRIVDLPFTWIEMLDRSGDRVLVHAGSAELAGALWLLDLGSQEVTSIRSDVDDPPSADWLPQAEELSFPSPRGDVHAVYYAPRHPAQQGPEGELPPLVALVHGGPTAHTQASVDLSTAFYTSRGIAVVDVNYGGSTGYGRAYRERLRGQWGVVDIEDLEIVATGLAATGRVDPNRMAIEGGSAGGWTVLGALVRGEVFACGVSRYGVADLRSLQAVTHDFESRYNDSLVGPYDDDPELWERRSPLSRAAELDRPVLLLQGLDDPVVPPSQSEAFRDALVEAGVPHAYLTFEGEGHGFRRSETKQRVREAALSFYGQVFGFEPDVPRLELWRPASEAEDGADRVVEVEDASALDARLKAERNRAVAGPVGPLALVNTQIIDSPQPVWGVKGHWAPLPDGASGLLLTASADDGIVVDGAVVDGTVVVAGPDSANPSSIRFDDHTVGALVRADGGSMALRVWDSEAETLRDFDRIDAF
ncbi:MAG: prolyl oligopeptidase family serine peptidase, partial [Naasia sp.]